MASKAGKANAKKVAAAEKEASTPAPPVPTEKEIALQQELENLNIELKKLQGELKELQEENEWLQQEAQQTRVESHEYLSFISRKTQKRQNALISLSDYNAHEIEKINANRERLIEEHKKRKALLEEERLKKEAELKQAEIELSELVEFQVMLDDQQTVLRALEKELEDKRSKHTDNVQELKANFLREKHKFQSEADSKIQEISLDANQEARKCLAKHSSEVKEENKRLRKDLLALIYRTRALHNKKLTLEEQHRALLREQKYYNKTSNRLLPDVK